MADVITDLVRAKMYATMIVGNLRELQQCVEIEGHDHTLFERSIMADLDKAREFVNHAAK